MTRYIIAIIILVVVVSLFFVKFNPMVNSQNESGKVEVVEPEPELTSSKNFVFMEFDYKSTAQSLIGHLKKKDLSFPVKLIEENDKFSVAFEYFDENQKEKKIAEIQRLTGTTISYKGGNTE